MRRGDSLGEESEEDSEAQVGFLSDCILLRLTLIGQLIGLPSSCAGSAFFDRFSALTGGSGPPAFHDR